MQTQTQHRSRPALWLLIALCLLLPAARPGAAQSPASGPRHTDWHLTAADFVAGDREGARGVYTSPPHQSPYPFTAVAAHWQATGPVTVALRLSSDALAWSPWYTVTAELEGDRWYAENLIVHQGARWMQARLTLGDAAQLSALTLTAIDAGPGPALAAAQSQTLVPQALGDLPQPPIISRAGWGADESLLDWPPAYAAPRKIILHHTVSGGSDDPPAEVRAIYYYHAVVRGWGDIGYNYLVDKYGNIYEGRAGGPGVVAGHTYGYNTGSVGIGNLGTYTATAPTAEMLAANTALIAWLGSAHAIHPDSTSVFNGLVGPNVTGHRHYAPTQCPGDAFIETLPTLRAAAWSQLRAALPDYRAEYLSHNTPATLLVGQTVAVSHTLRNTGALTWYHQADPIYGTPFHLGYHWYTREGAPYVQPPEEDHRTPLLADVPYGSSITLPAALLTAPHEPGDYTLRWDMVHELVTWFADRDSPPLEVSVAVTHPVTLTARLLDNRGALVSGGGVRLNDGPLLHSDDGHYTFTQQLPGAHRLRAYDPGGQHLPNGDPLTRTLSGGEQAAVELVLVPFDNVVRNWGFEAGLQHWQSRHAAPSANAHSGVAGLALQATPGQSAAITQVVRLAPGTQTSTLSFRYTYATPAPGAQLIAEAQSAAHVTRYVLALTTPAPTWAHAWTDILASAGEPVTVSLHLHSPTPLTVHLDELTLGSGGSAGWRYHTAYLPLIASRHAITATPPVITCTEWLHNSGFEARTGWQILETPYPAAYTTAPTHSGSWAMRAGIATPQDNRYAFSSFEQTFTLPTEAISATLTYWTYPVTTDSQNDLHYVLLLDAANEIAAILDWGRHDTRQWEAATHDLRPFAGQTLTLRFGAYNDGLDGITALYVDDVHLRVCHPNLPP